jgi:hypothetical protein
MSDSPYQDWHDFNIEVGSKVAYQVGDQLITGTVTSINEDEKTGEITMTFDQFDVGPGWTAVE